ncbi:RidA family protein [Acidobacteriota bacterium]
MLKKIVATDEAPAAIGPYSQAVQVGDFIFISGQIPLLSQSGGDIPEGVEDQTRQVLKNISAILKAAGCDLEHVVKTTVYMKDLTMFNDMNDVYSGFFPENPPARATVEVSCLPKDVLVEIEAVAFFKR